MTTYKVLIPLDGSRLAEHALAYLEAHVSHGGLRSHRPVAHMSALERLALHAFFLALVAVSILAGTVI